MCVEGWGGISTCVCVRGGINTYVRVCVQEPESNTPPTTTPQHTHCQNRCDQYR